MGKSGVLASILLIVVALSCGSASPSAEPARKKKIYFASPLGFSELGMDAYRQLIARIEKCGVEVLDPWLLDPRTPADRELKKKIDRVLALPAGSDLKREWEQLNPLIGANNARMIDESDGVFAVLDGSDADSGTAAEVGYAAGKGKPVLGYRGDFRKADNEGAVVNLQVEYFVRLRGRMMTRLDQLESQVREVFKL